MDRRRLVAILAADVVGYSRLIGSDEAGTLARLRRLFAEVVRPIMSDHNGRIFKLMGDAFLAEFGSAVDAVLAALALQEAVKIREGAGLRLRVGVHLGDVVVEGSDLLGDGVNVAARLESEAEPGAIAVSAAVADAVRGRVPCALVDLGERALKNIDRPVRVYRIGGSSAVPTPPVAGPPRLSLVVLPFANMSGDAEQGYVADGITEDLTTDLSRIAGSFVIARNTAFTFKGRAVDIRQIGQELGVRYALEGSVRRVGQRLRINAQLVDASSGAHLWAERFDGDLGDIASLQDKVTAHIAHSLGHELVRAESRRSLSERPNNPDAVDLIMRATALMDRPFTREAHLEIRNLFARAEAMDPGNPQASLGVAYIDSTAALFGWNAPPFESAKAAERRLDAVLAAAPNDAQAHATRCLNLLPQARPAEMERSAERAIALDRNHAWAHFYRGLARIYLGRSAEAIPDFERAIDLSPRESRIGIWLHGIGFAHFFLGNDELAIDWETRAIEAGDRRWLPFATLAAAFAFTGEEGRARAAVAEALRANPQLSLAWVRANRWSDDRVFLGQRERLYVGLRQAGLA